jgi:hypothetical protein
MLESRGDFTNQFAELAIPEWKIGALTATCKTKSGGDLDYGGWLKLVRVYFYV